MVTSEPHQIIHDNTYRRILNLPAELRTEIYSYVFPFVSAQIIIRARYGGLRWLTASSQIFMDAASWFYGRVSFLTYTKPLPSEPVRSLAMDFDDHLRLTYGAEHLHWIRPVARRMVRHVVVEVSLDNYVDHSFTVDRLMAYFKDIGQFVKLKTLRIRFHSIMTPYLHEFQNPGSQARMRLISESRAGDGSLVMIGSSSLENALHDSLVELQQRLPEDCELQVPIHGTWKGDGTVEYETFDAFKQG